MKKWIIKLLVIFLSLSVLLFMCSYIYFVKIPTRKAQIIVTKFEIAIRNNDIKSVKELVATRSPFVAEILLPRLELFKNEFDKFHEGIEIHHCRFYPENIYNLNKGHIVAYGRMKAKVDNQYREYFEIFLEKENNQWRIGQFAFPDYIDY